MRSLRFRLFLLIFSVITALPASSEPQETTSVAEFTTACEATSNMPTGQCECIGTSAKRDLSPQGFEFFTAMMQKDNAKTAALRQEMPFEELTAASMYLLNGAQACAETHRQ